MKLHKIILENKFFLKMLLTYCLVIFVGLGLTSYLVTSNMIGILTEMESRFDNEVIKKVGIYSDDRFKDVKSIFTRLYQKQYFDNNTSIVDFINPHKEAQVNKDAKIRAVSSYLQDTCSANAFITDIFIIDYNGKEIFFCSNVPARDVSIDYDFYSLDFLGKNGINNTVKIIPNYIPDYINTSSVNDFSVITYCIFLFDENSVKFDKPLGIAAVNMRADFFKTAYKDSAGFKGNIFVVGSNDLTLFDSSGALSGEQFPFEEFSASSFDSLESNEKYIVNKLHSEETSFSFINIVDKRVIEKATDGIHKSINNIIAVCVALTLLISLISASAFARRIRLLVRNMKDVENGNLDTRIAVGSDDEIGYLEQSFNTMCMKLDEYIKNVYVFEIKTKTAELRALQTQINPHFLFNTLESIRVTAQINNDAQAAKMIHILGNLFRWNIKVKGMFVDLKEEIDYVRSYIELQKLRHDNAFSVSIDVEPAALKLGVPKLILQPIVENAINHGLSNNIPGSHIGVEGRLDGGRLILRVSDNGKGMDDDKVMEVVGGLGKIQDGADLHHIGLSNVHQRISILFGESYGLKIKSRLGTGTEIELSIPAMSKEEIQGYVQSSDS